MSSLPADPSRPDWNDEGVARTDYRSRLRDLDDEFVAIAAEIADAVGPATGALLRGDRSGISPVHARDQATRQRCRQLEDACVVLIARESPVAADLREVVAVLRAVTDLDRSSRLLVHIVDALDRIDPTSMGSALVRPLHQLAGAVDRVFRAGAAAWQARDGLAINELTVLDDEVDLLEQHLLAELYLGDHPVRDVIAVTLLGRHFERLADHGVALAEHVSWIVTGERVAAS